MDKRKRLEDPASKFWAVVSAIVLFSIFLLAAAFPAIDAATK